jgi:hypothetical protein
VIMEVPRLFGITRLQCANAGVLSGDIPFVFPNDFGCSMGGIEIDNPETYFDDVRPLVRSLTSCASVLVIVGLLALCVCFSVQPQVSVRNNSE